MKYTIYHIPEVKVGCTSRDPKQRVKEQGYIDYEILGVTEDAIHASELEVEWQKKFGYTRDNKGYHYTLIAQKKSNTEEAKRKKKVTWKTSVKWKKGREVMGKKQEKPILQFSKNGTFIKEWPSAKSAISQLKLSQSGVSMCLAGKYKSSGGYIWKYA